MTETCDAAHDADVCADLAVPASARRPRRRPVPRDGPDRQRAVPRTTPGHDYFDETAEEQLPLLAGPDRPDCRSDSPRERDGEIVGAVTIMVSARGGRDLARLRPHARPRALGRGHRGGAARGDRGRGASDRAIRSSRRGRCTGPTQPASGWRRRPASDRSRRRTGRRGSCCAAATRSSRPSATACFDLHRLVRDRRADAGRGARGRGPGLPAS